MSDAKVQTAPRLDDVALAARAGYRFTVRLLFSSARVSTGDDEVLIYELPRDDRAFNSIRLINALDRAPSLRELHAAMGATKTTSYLSNRDDPARIPCGKRIG